MEVGPTYFLAYAIAKWAQHIAPYYEDHYRGFLYLLFPQHSFYQGSWPVGLSQYHSGCLL